MSGSEVLKTGCRREKAGQCGYWKGMTGHCVTHGKCMETIGFTLSMHSTEFTLTVGLEFQSMGLVKQPQACAPLGIKVGRLSGQLSDKVLTLHIHCDI